MRRAFLDYLAAQDIAIEGHADGTQAMLRTAREPIGAIAFSYGMITGADIDEILDDQRHDARPFGEIAIEKGLLTEERVRTLLQVQQLRMVIEIAEALALSGVYPLEEVSKHIARFLLTVPEDAIGVG